MQKCKDAGFCRRHRGKQGPRFDVLADTLTVSGHQLGATLRNSLAGKDLVLSLKSYSSGGVVRLTIDEDPKSAIFNGSRYRITPDADVTLPEFESNTKDWKTMKKDAKEVGKAPTPGVTGTNRKA
jgi:hypothetical protein